MALKLSNQINLQILWLLMTYLTEVRNLDDQKAAMIVNSFWGFTFVIPLFLQMIVDAITGLPLMIIFTSIFYCMGLLGLGLQNVKELPDSMYIHLSIGILLILGISGHSLNLEKLIREEDLSKNKQMIVVFVSLLVQVIGVLTAPKENIWQKRFIFGLVIMVSGTTCFLVGICLYKPVTGPLRERERERGGNRFVPKIILILLHLVIGVLLSVGDSFYIIQASRLCIDCRDLGFIVGLLKIECMDGGIIQIVLRIGYYVAKEFIGFVYCLIGDWVKDQKGYATCGFYISIGMVGVGCYKASVLESMIVNAKMKTEKITLPHYTLIWPQVVLLAAADTLAEKSLDRYFSFPRSPTESYIRLFAYLFSGIGMLVSTLFSKLAVHKRTALKTAATFIIGTKDADNLSLYFFLLFMGTTVVIFLRVVVWAWKKISNNEGEVTDNLPALENTSELEVVEDAINDRQHEPIVDDDEQVLEEIVQTRKRKYDGVEETARKKNRIGGWQRKCEELIEETERRKIKIA